MGACLHTYGQQGLHVGIQGLPQSTWLFNEDDSNEGPELDYKSTWGWGMGLRLGYNFTDYVGIETGLLFSKQGQKYQGELDWTGEKADMTAHTQLNYLKIPILFVTGSDPSASSAFRFFTGPQFMLLTKSKTTYKEVGRVSKSETNVTEENLDRSWSVSGGAGTISGTYKMDSNPYKKSQFAWVLGFGSSFKVSDNFFIDLTLRLDYAFGDAENKDCNIIQPTSSTKYWDKLESKFISSTNPNIKPRANTMNVTGGFQLGFTYVMPTN